MLGVGGAQRTGVWDPRMWVPGSGAGGAGGGVGHGVVVVGSIERMTENPSSDFPSDRIFPNHSVGGFKSPRERRGVLHVLESARSLMLGLLR